MTRKKLPSISIGDVLIGYHANSGLRATKTRPLMGLGGYYNHYSNLIGATVSPLSRKDYPSDFKTLPSFYNRTWSNDKECALKLPNLASYPLEHFNQKTGIIKRLKQEFYPDIIYARVDALLFNPKSEHEHPLFDFNNVAHYTGPVFTDITIDHVDSGVNAPDVNGSLSEKGITHSLPENCPLSQGDIDAIAKYAGAQGINAKRSAKAVNKQKPIAGTWPNWPDLEWEGETITCCAEGTKERLNAAPQTPTTTAQTKPNAAAKKASKYGHITLGQPASVPRP